MITIAEKTYVFAKDQYLAAKDHFGKHEITVNFKITERLPSTDPVDLVSDPVDFVSSTDSNVKAIKIVEPSNQLPIRDIVWIVVILGVTYYLGQRIDFNVNNFTTNPIIDLSPEEPKIPTPEYKYQKFDFTWWEKLTLPKWMIQDLSDEGTFGKYTRRVPILPEPEETIEPIANSRPRRFIVIINWILHLRIRNNTDSKPTSDTSKTPTWVFSPLFYVLEKIYKKFNN